MDAPSSPPWSPGRTIPGKPRKRTWGPALPGPHRIPPGTGLAGSNPLVTTDSSGQRQYHMPSAEHQRPRPVEGVANLKQPWLGCYQQGQTEKQQKKSPAGSSRSANHSSASGHPPRWASDCGRATPRRPRLPPPPAAASQLNHHQQNHSSKCRNGYALGIRAQLPQHAQDTLRHHRQRHQLQSMDRSTPNLPERYGRKAANTINSSAEGAVNARKAARAPTRPTSAQPQAESAGCSPDRAGTGIWRAIAELIFLTHLRFSTSSSLK